MKQSRADATRQSNSCSQASLLNACTQGAAQEGQSELPLAFRPGSLKQLQRWAQRWPLASCLAAQSSCGHIISTGPRLCVWQPQLLPAWHRKHTSGMPRASALCSTRIQSCCSIASALGRSSGSLVRQACIARGTFYTVAQTPRQQSPRQRQGMPATRLHHAAPSSL